MNDVMLDLETVGTGNNAAIIAIGACMFDIKTGDIGAEFYYPVDLESSGKHGTVDMSTILWWMKQSDDARAVFNDEDKIDLDSALSFFLEWICQIEPPRDRRVWGNGSTFDNVIMKSAFNRMGFPYDAWPFYCDRDVRTIVDLGRRILNFDPKKDMPFEGTVHNALDDAKHQARYVSKIYQELSVCTLESNT
jgi:exodeoxyribonuclease VIII